MNALKYVSRQNATKIADSLDKIEEAIAEEGEGNKFLEAFTQIRRPALGEIVNSEKLDELDRWTSEEALERIRRGRARYGINWFYNHSPEGAYAFISKPNENLATEGPTYAFSEKFSEPKFNVLNFNVLNFNDLELTIFDGRLDRGIGIGERSSEYWDENTSNLLWRGINPEAIILTKFGEIDQYEMLSRLVHMSFNSQSSTANRF